MPGMGMRVNIIAPWFIRTPIMSSAVQQMITEKGVTFAEKTDAAAAVLHLASDRTINGRACGILPRDIAKEGYVDLDRDDDDVFADSQKIVLNASHRIGTK